MRLASSLLTILVFLPVAGAVVVALAAARRGAGAEARGPGRHRRRLRRLAALVTGFKAAPGMQFEARRAWLPDWGISYHVGIDGLSLWLVILTTFLTPLALLGSWSSIDRRVKEFNVFMLLLEAGMLGVFVALDLFLFYIFWEAMLIPMYFLIGIWGHERRIYAAVKFFLYTMAGSVLMLVAFLVVYRATGVRSFDIAVLAQAPGGAGPADVALRRLRPGLRHQGPHVPVPHLAARRARRGPHRGLGDPGRRAPQDGRLRVPAPGHPALPPGRAWPSRPGSGPWP